MDQNGPKAPEDEKTKNLIETLAKNVAKHGKTLEKNLKEKHSTVSFLDEGKEFNDYYKHRVNIFSKYRVLKL